MKTVLLIMAVWAVLLTGSCARDRDAEDFCREQLGEQLGKYGETTGVYRGMVYSRRDHTPLAMMSLELETGTRVGSTNGDCPNNQQPILRGVAYLITSNKGAVMFQDGSYDSELKTLKTTVSVTLDSDREVEIDISGNFQGDRFSGAIEAFGFPEVGGTFELVKNGPLPEAGALLGGANSSSTQAEPAIYDGVLALGASGQVPVTLIAVRQNRRTDQRVADLLMPVRWVQLAMNFGREGKKVTALFPNAQWDERVGTLVGKTTVILSGESVEIGLDCEEFTVPGYERAALRCRYTNSRGVFSVIDFLPRRGGSQ